MCYFNLVSFGIGKPGYLRNSSDAQTSVTGSNPVDTALLGIKNP